MLLADFWLSTAPTICAVILTMFPVCFVAFIAWVVIDLRAQARAEREAMTEPQYAANRPPHLGTHPRGGRR